MSGKHARSRQAPGQTGGGPAQPSRGARGRQGRTLVEGWIVALAALLVLVVLGVAVRALVRPDKTAAASRTAAKTGAKTGAKASSGGKAAETAVFAKMKKYGVAMHFPAVPADMVAIGFHQAWNLKATDMVPVTPPHPRDEYAATKQALKADPSLKTFLMMSRGRGSSQYSAADCAVRPGAIVLAPVTGTVTLVKTYKLSGYGTDYQVEIEPDGASAVRVVLIHIKDVVVREGDRVAGGVSPVATVRHLTGIDNQVNRYLPVAADHTHIQINAVGYKLNEAS